MPLLFDRVYRLEVGGEGETLTIDGGAGSDDRITDPARIQFRVTQGASAYVTRAQVAVYGLSRETRQKAYERYTRLKLTAGFRDNYGQIFSGDIYNSEILRDGPENIIAFYCRATGLAWTETNVVKTFGAGTPMFDVVREAAQTYGVEVEFVGDFSDLPTLASSMPVSMGTGRFMQALARNFGFTYQYEPSRFVIYRDTAIRETLHTTSATTGMVGTPLIRERGIDVTLKMNPNIRLRDQIEVTNLTGQLVYNNPDAVRFEDSIGTGRYVTQAFAHIGDFYGDQWDTQIEGLNPREIKSGNGA